MELNMNMDRRSSIEVRQKLSEERKKLYYGRNNPMWRFDIDIDKILDLYFAGTTSSIIAKKLKIDRTVVYNRLVKLNLPYKIKEQIEFIKLPNHNKNDYLVRAKQIF